MKKLLFLVILGFGVLIAKEYENFPGGYIGISINYGSQHTIGLQISLGVAVPSVGKPSLGPYLFPGAVSGLRYSIKNKTTYLYTDAQLLYVSNGIWSGLAKGIAFYKGNKISRSKLFGGYLTFGGMVEKMPLIKEQIYYKGLHFGIAIPLIGTHIYP